MNDAEMGDSFVLQRSLNLSAHGDNETPTPDVFYHALA
jgi:hypothetical protein